MTSRISKVACLLAVLGLVAAACGSSSKATTATTAASAGSTSSAGSTGSATTAAGSKQTNVQVGVVMPLSGQYAAYGADFANGVRAGISYLNAGHSVAHVHYTAVYAMVRPTRWGTGPAAKQLTQQGIRYFVGDVISATGYIAEQTTFNQVGAVNFTTESSQSLFNNAGIGKTYPWAYGVGGSVAIYTVPFINYLKAHNVTKVAIVYMNYEDEAVWGTQVEALAKAAGIQVSIQGLSPTTTDATAQLRTLRASGATTLLNEAIDPLTHTILTGLNQIGWTPNLIVSETPSPADASGLPSSLLSKIVAGPVPLGFLGSSTSAQPSALTASYLQYYTPLSGEKAGKYTSTTFNGSYTFDAMLVLDQAIAKAGSTSPAAVRTALDSGQTFTGSRGSYVFGPTTRNGPLTSNAGLYVYAPGCPNGVCQNAG